MTRTWRKSTFYKGRTCVEVALVDEAVAVRDSKKPEKLAFPFTQAGWGLFLAKVHAGEFDSAILQRKLEEWAPSDTAWLRMSCTQLPSIDRAPTPDSPPTAILLQGAMPPADDEEPGVGEALERAGDLAAYARRHLVTGLHLMVGAHAITANVAGN